MYYYKLCGLNLESVIKIPIFEKNNSVFSPDLTISFSEESSSSILETFRWGNKTTIFKNDSIFFRRRSGLVFEINNDSKIYIYLNDSIDKETIWESIIGVPMGFALRQKGFTVMHGSAVSFKSNTVCIIGTSGLGKSTIALSLFNMGYNFITEDLCIIKNKKIYPYSPWIKSTPEVIDNLKIKYSDHLNLKFDLRKRSLFKLENFSSNISHAPKIAFFPIEGSESRIVKMNNDKIFKFLFTNFYRTDFTLEEDLNSITKISELFNCYSFERDINKPINENINFLSEHIESILN